MKRVLYFEGSISRRARWLEEVVEVFEGEGEGVRV